MKNNRARGGRLKLMKAIRKTKLKFEDVRPGLART